MNKITFSQRIHLMVFPAIQVVLILLTATVSQENLLPLLWVFPCALALGLSLHISYHYLVHFPIRNKSFNSILGCLVSILIGMPFQYYKMSHWNHHKYNNQLGDFTSTWKMESGKVVPRSIFFYGLFWFLGGSIPLLKQFEVATKEGYLNEKGKKEMLFQFTVVILFWLLLAKLSLLFLFGYLGVIYFGWLVIAIINYGQHLPMKYGDNKGFSYLGRLYNKILINNGLHEEHHDEPVKTYWQLLEKENGKRLQQSHLTVGIFGSWRKLK